MIEKKTKINHKIETNETRVFRYLQTRELGDIGKGSWINVRNKIAVELPGRMSFRKIHCQYATTLALSDCTQWNKAQPESQRATAYSVVRLVWEENTSFEIDVRELCCKSLPNISTSKSLTEARKAKEVSKLCQPICMMTYSPQYLQISQRTKLGEKFA